MRFLFTLKIVYRGGSTCANSVEALMATPTIYNNEIMVPSVESRIFDVAPEAQFAIGRVAVGNTPLFGLDQETEAYLKLRGNIYAKQQHYMPVEELNADGTETDEDDARSVHIAAIENTFSGQRVMGGMRLVIKSHANPRRLPVEHHYPGVFDENPAPIVSAEASRVISRHEDPRIQKMIKWQLFKEAVEYLVSEQVSVVYGVVKPQMTRGLRIEGMPLEELAPAEFIPEINSKKQPIRIDLDELARRMGVDGTGNSGGKGFVYSGHLPHAPHAA